jgi:hypothetical protein
MTTDTRPHVPAGTDVFYDVAMARLAAQMSRIDSLDSKVASTFSLTTGIVPLFGGLLVLAGKNPTTLVSGLYGAAAGVYVLIVAFSALAYFGAKWDFRPHLQTLADHSATNDAATVKRWVAKECIRSVEKNEARLTRKGWYVTGAVAGLAVESGLLAFAAFAALN